jgi:hypothetical protein
LVQVTYASDATDQHGKITKKYGRNLIQYRLNLTIVAKYYLILIKISKFWHRWIPTGAGIWVGGIQQWLRDFVDSRLLEHEGRLRRLKDGRLLLLSEKNNLRF